MVQEAGVRDGSSHVFNGSYAGAALAHIAFPMGGIGAGMICLEGFGALSNYSLRHRPDLTSEYKVFAALCIRGMENGTRVLQGPVPGWKSRPHFTGEWGRSPNTCWGLPRFAKATFEARFPFATVSLEDERMPVSVELTGWSPFAPGDADDASLPVAGLEYRFVNRGATRVQAVFSFNSENFMATSFDQYAHNPKNSDRVLPTSGGFILHQPGVEGRPWDEGDCAIWLDEPNARVNHVWFRGQPPMQMEMLWSDLKSGRCAVREPDFDRASPGASLFLPFELAPGEAKTVRLHMAWYVPRSNLFEPNFRVEAGKAERITQSDDTYRPWYAERFAGVDGVKRYWQSNYERLRQAAELFSRTFYDSTLPPEAIEAIAANLTILKSPTVLRQPDGRLWGWEGTYDDAGSCYGSSNHVWNYAQTIAHLFPSLERSLRETEFGANQGKDGYQAIRAALPIRPIGDTREDAWGFPAAADGQLGGIIKVYRDWRISGDTEWLRALWPKIRSSLDFCIRTWDPTRRGSISEPHINTYDVEFWGADSACTSLYVGALRAAVLMGTALGDDIEVYSALHTRAVRQLETELFNGEYFLQRIEWRTLQAAFPPNDDGPLARLLRQYPEMRELALVEGPPFQCGEGCLADGLLGVWLSLVCGMGDILDRAKVESHLRAVFRHNFRTSLVDHKVLKRAFFATAEEAGLVVCTWPNGGRTSMSMFFSDEVWTGTEYQVASHLISLGQVDAGITILQACRRRYDGRLRNPFADIEAGHWYARALSSYALLQAFSGARYDAVESVLYLKPAIKGDFRCFLATAQGYGTVGVKDGEPFMHVIAGEVPYSRIEYVPH